MGIYVQFHARLAQWEADLSGGFTVHRGVPTIQLYRIEGQMAVENPLEELLTLAHEYGHAVSWREGRRTKAYVAVVDRMHEPDAKFDETEALLILDEECRAWRRARTVLAEVGFEKRTEFEQRQANDLKIYCERLGIGLDRWHDRLNECERAPSETAPGNSCDTCSGLGWVLQYEDTKDLD